MSVVCVCVLVFVVWGNTGEIYALDYVAKSRLLAGMMCRLHCFALAPFQDAYLSLKHSHCRRNTPLFAGFARALSQQRKQACCMDTFRHILCRMRGVESEH